MLAHREWLLAWHSVQSIRDGIIASTRLCCDACGQP
jgi:hypothetical protein